jgi:uncharacterized protein (TIGR00106 family)
MSVLIEFAMFPTDKGSSVSDYVSRILKTIRDSGHEYRLNPMGTVVETETIKEALQLVEKAYECLEPDCDRVYSAVKMDIRKGSLGRMSQKVDSIQTKIGEVST